jgi:alpha-beta hydrolase superfamily lysophospholipase
LKGTRLVEQFLRYEGVSRNGLHTFRFFWCTYWGRVGGGGTVEAGAELRTDEAGRPVEYEIFSDREAVRRIVFGDREAMVCRSDGSSLTIPLPAPVRLVVDDNIILHIAILLPTLRGIQRVKADFFSPFTLMRSNLVMERRKGTAWDTNLGFSLRGDTEGRLKSLAGADGVVSGVRLEMAFPEVDWAGLRRPKLTNYRAPRAIRSRDIAIKGEVILGGALSLPRRGRQPYPALLFLQGSGRHDRHGISAALDTGVHEIVDGLAASGYVGLRFDSRGAGSSCFGDAFESGIDARLKDARAALRALAASPEVDRKNIFLIGHSLGALIAMQVATEARVRGVVLLAPPGRRIDHVVIEQALREMARLGISVAETKRRRSRLRRMFSAVDNAKSNRMRDLKWGLSYLTLRDLMRFDPLDMIRKVNLPLLICQGAKDIQVSPERDALPLFLAAAERNSAAEVVILADGDHLFRHETHMDPSPAHYFVPRPLAEALLDVLRDWLQRNLCVPKSSSY